MKQLFLLWIRRVSLFVIALAALAATGAAAFVLIEKYRMAQYNRTHERSLADAPDGHVLSEAKELIADLSPMSGDNGLRFAAMPSFGNRWFAVSLSDNLDKADAEVIIWDRTTNTSVRRTFQLPRENLLNLLERWDELTIGYSGEGRGLTDGNPIAFERFRGREVFSGVGNSPCHYDVLGDLAATYLTSYVPELEDLRNPDIDKYLQSEFC